MKRRRNLNSKQDAGFHIDTGKDKAGLDVKFISDFKGMAVFACAPFEKGDFLLEYCGELISKQECERRVRVYHDALKHFLFEFRFDGKLWCVDAAKDGSLGRLVNDDHIHPNTKIKYLSIQGKPHLCLFAIRHIDPGDEITYNYGDSDWPWRGEESGMKSANDHRDYTPSTSKLTTKECMSTAHVEVLAQKCLEREDSSITVSQREQSLEFEPQCSSVEQPASEIPPRDAGDAELCLERGDFSISVSQREQSLEFEPQCSSVEQPSSEIPPRDAGDAKQCPKHSLVCGDISAKDKCSHCQGPFASLRWMGYKCKDEISFSDTEAKDSGSDSEDSSTEAKEPQLEDMEILGQSSGCAIVELSQNSEDLNIVYDVTSTGGGTTPQSEDIISEVTSTAGGTKPQSEEKNAVQECKARRLPKRTWSYAEVAAVIHFGNHIPKGKLASKAECKCSALEAKNLARPVLPLCIG